MPKSIASYSTEILDPVLLTGDPKKILRVESEQIYSLRLFSAPFCRRLIDRAEASRPWLHDTQASPAAESTAPPEKMESPACLSLARIPGMPELYRDVVDRHVRPLVKILWLSFEMQMYRMPYILRYDSRRPPLPGSHEEAWDQCAVSLVVSLNDEFEGGGTFFPRWNYSTGRPRPGWAILYPGGISHPHRALPIHKGKRYLLIGEFFQRSVADGTLPEL